MTDTPDILRRIVARKREEIMERASRVSQTDLSVRLAEADPVRGFADAIAARIGAGKAGVIAEIKKASPSRGILREDFDPEQIASSYERGGAACLSVLTDIDFFKGDDAFLQKARAACKLPSICDCEANNTSRPWRTAAWPMAWAI